MIYLEELLAIFSMSEQEQADYFPQFREDVWAHGGDCDCPTRHARLVALCLLIPKAREAELADDPELAALGLEIAGLATLIIESTASWEWLVWHPHQITEDRGQVTPDIYRVWSILRRLSRAASAGQKWRPTPRPFMELFGPMIQAPDRTTSSSASKDDPKL